VADYSPDDNFFDTTSASSCHIRSRWHCTSCFVCCTKDVSLATTIGRKKWVCPLGCGDEFSYADNATRHAQKREVTSSTKFIDNTKVIDEDNVIIDTKLIDSRKVISDNKVICNTKLFNNIKNLDDNIIC
jgi:hypothetical protein